MITCITEVCDNPVENKSTGLCASCGHAMRKAERQASKVRIVSPIKKITQKRAAQTVEYTKLRREYLALYPVCEVPECNLKATEIHHQKGKTNDLLLDTNYFMSVCHGHHKVFTEHSKEAIEKGYSVLRTK